MKKIKVIVLFLFLATFSLFAQEKKYTTYKALKGETVQTISKKFLITPYTLLQLNPDIKDVINEGQLIIVPNKNYKPTVDKEQRGDYIEDGFLYHRVLPKENYFRLKRQFGVAKRILRKHNLALKTGDLKAGQVIKIPIKKGRHIALPTKEKEVEETKPYLVRPKETKRSISRRYGITVEQLEELNPNLKVEVLKMATIINVPNTKEIPDSANNDFVTHLVKKGETFYSLGKLYELTEEQLITLNPELKEGVKEGMILKIPMGSFEENSNIFVAQIPQNTQLNIAMMLPFTGKKSSLDFENNRTLDRVTDFYLGALIALDSIKKQGVSVSMKVFDTQNNTSSISTILRANDFKDTDAIVGPMFLNNVKFVAQNLRIDSVAIISPASSKNHAEFASNNMIKEIPSDELLERKVLDYLTHHYNNQQLIVIANGKKESEAKVAKIVATLKTLDSLQKVTVLKPEEGYIKPDLFKEVILKDKENWILLIADEDDVAMTADVINNLGVLPEEIKATLFALDYGSNFDKVDNNHLARINFHYPTTYFVDDQDVKTQQFIKKYRYNNHADPTEYAFKGFDITYDVIMRLATYQTNLDDAFSGGVSERASCKFEYTKNPTKGFENKGVFLVKYDGLNLKKVDEDTEVDKTEE